MIRMTLFQNLAEFQASDFQTLDFYKKKIGFSYFSDDDKNENARKRCFLKGNDGKAMGYEIGRKYHKHFVSGPRSCKGGRSLCVKEKYIKIAYIEYFFSQPYFLKNTILGHKILMMS